MLRSMWCPEVPRGVSCLVVSHGVPLSEIESEIDSEIDVVSYGVPLSEIDREIDSETDREIERCPAVSRGVPRWPLVSRGVPLSEIDIGIDSEIE
eukprot:1746769-Pyramimonas_sp.AAC.1